MNRLALLPLALVLAGCGAMNDNPVSQQKFDQMYEKRQQEMRNFDPSKQVAPGIDQEAAPAAKPPSGN
ncbi:MAG: hypothetical protein LDL56_00265 [Armatimonadetes bacterium]|jgi:hypothetical protein|nr:hypothetical protein [Armatimonadota bacterium]